MDFITRDQLIAAMQSWVFDKQKPLGQVLSEQGVLSPEDHEAIETLLRRHLLRHDDDAERSLASLSSIGPVRDALARIADPDVQASLPRLGAARRDTESTLTYVGSPTAPGGRFRILRPHARGGLGVVSVAMDEEIHREVALKEIQEQYASQSGPRSRFLLEAEITGGLEHPGIVPVYGLGHHPDGRPFYAMRFIRGESLKEAVARFHTTLAPVGREPEPHPTGSQAVGPMREHQSYSTESETPPTGAVEGTRAPDRANHPARAVPMNTLELRRLLSRFLEVCNAIAYAHSRGVLHRDIKPGNILLGPYGETLVVDWGLAKIVGRDETDTSEPSTEPTLRPLSASGTGETIPGTALGTPAYMSPEQAEGRLDLLGPASDVYSLGATLYVVLTGRAPFAGDDAAEVIRKVQRGDFASPRAVNPRIPNPLEAICLKAMALKPSDRYETPRPLAEDIEHWMADEPLSAYREPWPHRVRRWSRKHRTVVTSAAAVLLLGLLGSVGFGAVMTAKNRELAKQTERAEKREQMAVQAVERFRDAVVEEPVLKNNPALAELRKKLLKEPLKFFKSLREQLQADNETRPGALKRLAEAAHEYAHLTQEIGDIQDGLRSHLESLAVWERLVRDHPATADYQHGLAMTEMCRGNMLDDAGHPEQAAEPYGKALVIRERLARDNPNVAKFQRELAMIHFNIGTLQSRTGHPDQAAESHGRALAIWERLVRDHPAEVVYQDHLALTQEGRGNALDDTGRADQALESYLQALAIRDRLARDNPNVPEFQLGLGMIHNNIGILQSRTGHPGQALKSFGKALAIRERLARHNPSVNKFQRGVALMHFNIGELESQTGQPDRALDSYGKALAIRERLAIDHPSSLDEASDLGATLNNMAMIDIDANRFAEARSRLHQAISWQKKALAANPTRPTYREFLRDHLRNLIKAANALGNFDEATAAQRELDESAATDPAMIALDARLAGVIRGEVVQDNSERLRLAYRAYERKLTATSARLFAEALEADPKLADDRQARHRYNGARSAVLASTERATPTLPSPIEGEEKTGANAVQSVKRGEIETSSPLVGEDRGGGAAPPPADVDRARLRNQARAWLEVELKAWSSLLESAKGHKQRHAIAGTLEHWREDTDLAGVRDEAALAKLPGAEREAWTSLWAKVDRLLANAHKP
jgi:serine/threonine-protein kinase